MERVHALPLLISLVGATLTLVSWWLVGRLRDAGLHHGLLDRPNARSSHTRPTPRLGGVALLAMVGLPGLLGCALAGPGGSSMYLLLVLLGLVVGLVSLLDDLRGLPALLRLGTHIGVAFGVVARVGAPTTLMLPGGSEWPLGLAAWPLALLWVVGCINAFNFMDGIDGLAGGQGVVLGLAWLVIGLLLPWPSLQLLGLLLASSSTGFLLHNWAPARIFMGDSGSAFLGYWAAVAPFCTPRPGNLLLPAALIIWPLLVDSGLTLLRRARAGESLLVAHRGHLYQRLVDRGAGQARVASAYVVLAACGAAAATLSVLEQHLYAVGAVLALPLVAGLLLAALPRPRHADSTR